MALLIITTLALVFVMLPTNAQTQLDPLKNTLSCLQDSSDKFTETRMCIHFASMDLTNEIEKVVDNVEVDKLDLDGFFKLSEIVCEKVKNSYLELLGCASTCEALEYKHCGTLSKEVMSVIRDQYDDNFCLFTPLEICQQFMRDRQ